MLDDERRWVDLVRSLQCSVCDAAGPSHAHEIEQGLWFASVALCPDCHQGPRNGLHGQRRMWALKKMDETKALAVTVRRAFAVLSGAAPERPGTSDEF